MPDVLNAVIKNTPRDSTYFQITSYSITPRGDVQGSTIAMHLFLHLTSALGDDPGIPSAERWFKGTIGGQAFAFMWKASATYMAAGDYQWDISFNAAYIYGTVATNLYCCNGNNVTGTSSTPVWGTSYTMNATAATLPDVPNTLTFAGVAGTQVVANYAAGLFHWMPGAGGTGGIRSYDVYYVIPGGGFMFLLNTTGAVTLNPAELYNTRGGYVSFSVAARNLYGASAINTASFPTIHLAQIPSAPSSFYGTPNPSPYKGGITLTWGGAISNSGDIDRVRIEVQHCPKGGVWTGWALVIETAYTPNAYTPIPFNYVAPYGAAPGSQYRFRIFVRNTFGLWSADYAQTVAFLMKGGIMKIKVAGVWKSGTAFIKVGGVWKEASSVYTRTGGTWKESI